MIVPLTPPIHVDWSHSGEVTPLNCRMLWSSCGGHIEMTSMTKVVETRMRMRIDGAEEAFTVSRRRGNPLLDILGGLGR